MIGKDEFTVPAEQLCVPFDPQNWHHDLGENSNELAITPPCSIPSFKASAKKNRDGEVAIPILFVMESMYGYQLPISEKIGILYVLLV